MRVLRSRVSPFALAVAIVLFGGFTYLKTGDAVVSPTAGYWLMVLGMALTLVLTVADLVVEE